MNITSLSHKYADYYITPYDFYTPILIGLLHKILSDSKSPQDSSKYTSWF